MRYLIRQSCVLAVLLSAAAVLADDYDDTINVFQDAGQSGKFFEDCYGYAVFPTVSKGGVGVGGAHGKGRVYVGGKHVGDTSMTQLTAGFQLGGQAFSQILFFQDERAFHEFARGHFEFGAQVAVVAITAGASAGTTTAGSSAGASSGRHDATTVGSYHKGLATFTVAEGGLMHEATVGHQKFDYKAL